MQEVRITKFGAVPDSQADIVPAVAEALAEIIEAGGGKLVFPRGRYDFWPDRATERHLFVSNNDPGLQRIAFPLIDCADIEIVGEGAEFVFHGAITPFVIMRSRSVSIGGFSIDYERPFVSEVKVLDAGANSDGACTVTVRIPEQYPYAVDDERLTFLGERDEPYPLHNVLEWNPVRRETEFRVFDNYHVRRGHRAREVSAGIVALTSRFTTIPTPGNVLAMHHSGRENPGIVIADSLDTVLHDVTIYHSRGMAVIAQWSENIRAERLKVIPATAKGRIISAAADATHFVNCKGLVDLIDCVFEGQMDDPTNIHGIYARISRILDDTTLEVEVVHPQQYGIEATRAGDTIDLVANDTLLTLGRASVLSVLRTNKQLSVVTTRERIGSIVKPGDAITSHGWVCDATIRGCDTGRNRARGFLISTAGKVLIENNHFYNPGAAIYISGDVNHWFESGAVRDVTIRNNHFDNCLFGVWGSAVIQIAPEISPEHRSAGYFHQGIKIVGNTFDVFDPRVVRAYSVDGIEIAENAINVSGKYPVQSGFADPIDVTECRNVVMTANLGVDQLTGACGVAD